jgi:hypothetical protein
MLTLADQARLERIYSCKQKPLASFPVALIGNVKARGFSLIDPQVKAFFDDFAMIHAPHGEGCKITEAITIVVRAALSGDAQITGHAREDGFYGWDVGNLHSEVMGRSDGGHTEFVEAWSHIMDELENRK